jgi:hypothetical protein
VRTLTNILGAAALLCAMAPAAAPAAQPLPQNPASAEASIDGLWRGEVGGRTVLACFNATIGSFYAPADRKLIMLWAEQPLRWAEKDERDPANPRWNLRLQGNDRLAGERAAGRDAQALTLARLPAPAAEDADSDATGPCRSLAYHRERLEPLAVRERPARLGTAGYVEIVAAPASYPDAVRYQSFRVPGDAPGTAAVNALLARMIDLRGPGESEWSLCLAAAGNSGGDFHAGLAPVRIGRRFVAAEEEREASCGGAHPSSGSYPRLFDLVEGREVAMRDWLNPRALDGELLDERSEPNPDAEPNVLPLSAALRRVLVSKAGKPEPECAGTVDEETYWTVGVGRDALLFYPHLARAVRACGEEIALPFTAMAPFLSAEGKTALARLRADPAVFAQP